MKIQLAKSVLILCLILSITGNPLHYIHRECIYKPRVSNNNLSINKFGYIRGTNRITPGWHSDLHKGHKFQPELIGECYNNLELPMLDRSRWC